ncbi:phosphate/phosphite/phosphonate ABC transporter substrate-binding protein [Synechocystis sp. PCC 7509]|uniref:phosphate/phosphite/phosphonate ABC transporter substrate-binding protein n=1 Tax=Synechocystis sp. PCC 7509 TaxID=927677 RepID=UPI0002AC8FA1|nr:PhnD/SsuA/transferrin family substrate-binding protein [Synechocystis sp. PCC 7509]
MKKLSLVSYLAPNMFWFYEGVGAYLSRVLEVEVNIIQSPDEALKDRLLREDRLDIAFICGLPFIRHYQVAPNQLEAIVAPVMQAKRYQNRPVYFSDIIVAAGSSLRNLEDLTLKTWCYNDLGSNSGYYLLLHRLIEAGKTNSFLGKAIQSGSHQNSIRLVAEGTVDYAAIDSTVLEQELRNFPTIPLRIVESIGSNPIPPIVASQHLGATLIESVQQALLNPDLQLQSLMDKAQIQNYVAVESEDYRAIANIYDTVTKSGLTSLK